MSSNNYNYFNIPGTTARQVGLYADKNKLESDMKTQQRKWDLQYGFDLAHNQRTNPDAMKKLQRRTIFESEFLRRGGGSNLYTDYQSKKGEQEQQQQQQQQQQPSATKTRDIPWSDVDTWAQELSTSGSSNGKKWDSVFAQPSFLGPSVISDSTANSLNKIGTSSLHSRGGIQATPRFLPLDTQDQYRRYWEKKNKDEFEARKQRMINGSSSSDKKPYTNDIFNPDANSSDNSFSTILQDSKVLVDQARKNQQEYQKAKQNLEQGKSIY